MLRYLRIAVTALSLTACVLLVALWVRSYWWVDFLGGSLSDSHTMVLQSEWGQTDIRLSRDEHLWRWRLRSTPAAEEAIRRHSEMLKLRRVGATIQHPGPFHFEWTDQFLRLRMPHWLPAIITGMLAAMMGFRHFSLRTLLIATTLVAVGLGIVVATS